LPALLSYINEPGSAELRQAAAYGLALCATHCDQNIFSPYVDEAARQLLAGIHTSLHSTHLGHDRNSLEDGPATDNMVSALGRLAVLHDRPELLQPWLEGLPLTFDEAEPNHSQLVELVEAGHATIMGVNLANLPQILSVLAHVSLDESAEEELRIRAARAVAALPIAAVQQAALTLQHEPRRRVEEMLRMLSGH
jgi:hypothetical protein